MVIKSRVRFGASRELEALDPGRGGIGEWTSKSAKSVLDFGSRPGSGRVMSGSRSSRGRVEVESGSIEGLCSDFVNEHTPVRFTARFRSISHPESTRTHAHHAH